MDRLTKDGVRENKPIGAILRTRHVMPEDMNRTCSCRSNSLLSKSKKNGHLLSGELDYLCTARGTIIGNHSC